MDAKHLHDRFERPRNTLNQHSLHRCEVGGPVHRQLFSNAHFAAHRLGGEHGGYLRDGNFIGILGVGIVVIGDDHISVSSILVEPSTGTFSKPIPPARSTEK